MSCGLPPTPELALTPPGAPDVNLPRAPAVPNYSWAASDFPGLGLDVDPKVSGLPVPGAPDLNLPRAPRAPDVSWAMVDFGVELPAEAAELPVPELPDEQLPTLPAFDDVPCPFDEET